jgi:hypothetical protein
VDVVSVVRAEWDRVAGYALIAAGLACLVFAYFGVARSPFIAEELSYTISGGLGGLVLLGAGGTLLIIADLHDEWRKLARIEVAMGGSVGSSTRGLPEPIGRATVAAAAGFVIAAIVIVVTWNRAGGVADPKPALQDLAVAIVGLMAAGTASVGATLWLKATVKRRQSQLLAPWELADLVHRVHGKTATNGAAAPASGSLVVARGLSRYHREGCAAVKGLPTRAVTPERVPRGLEPCQLCEAGEPA